MLRKPPRIAIVGATGLVGNEMLTILSELEVPYESMKLLASADSVGEVYEVAGEECVVEELCEGVFQDVDVALFAVGGDLAQEYVPQAVSAGAVVIDNSRSFRMDPKVPLVVPEVNSEDLGKHSGIIANPNCSTIQLMPPLWALSHCAPLKRVVVSTYQAVSGAGKLALDDLWAQTRAVFTQQAVEPQAFANQIAFNCLPIIDEVLENGSTREEMKIVDESRKILSLPNLAITATAVRVPVFHSHAESVVVETEQEVSPEEFLAELSKVPGVEIHPEAREAPLQIDAAGGNDIHVGRVRRDPVVPNTLLFWIVADNLRKGAALNAVQILQALLADTEGTSSANSHA